jgi:RNA polymerase sigma factor (sigma-70 family)
MEENDSLAGPAGRFRTTRWSAVLLSAQSQAPGSQAALAKLCQIYWYPLYAFLRRHGYAKDEAEDLTQGFFLSLLDRKSLRYVRPEKGKFRSFLLASLRNYLSDAFDRRNSVKRGGQVEFVSLDLEKGEERFQTEGDARAPAEVIFDARWAMILLQQAMDRLQREYSTQQRLEVFQTLKPFLDPNAKLSLPTYEQVASQLNVSQGAAKTMIHRLRKRYSEILREEVGRTVSDPNSIDEEIHALCEALIAAEGHVEQ